MTISWGEGQPKQSRSPFWHPSGTLATCVPDQSEVMAEAQIYKCRTKESTVLACGRWQL
jgi:hypothetical protein